MKKTFYFFLLFLLSALEGWYSYTYLSGKWLLLGIFISGVGFGLFLMLFKVYSKTTALNSYKRKLEKEEISSDDSLAKVKLLESKISVLEKALENALNK